MARNSGIIKDTRVWDAMKKNLMRGKDFSVNTGFFDEYYGPENDNLPVAQVAQWQEEGTDKIPMRPFIRAGFMIKNIEKQEWLTPAIKHMISNVALGKMTWNQLYHKLGPVFVEIMKKEIELWQIPMNAPLTIELKGFNDPLIDSGKMLDSVEYRVSSYDDL